MRNRCAECGADWSLFESVSREYVNKDGGVSAFGAGHYEPEGMFEPDRKVDLSNGRFDLLDNSDSCISCGLTI